MGVGCNSKKGHERFCPFARLDPLAPPCHPSHPQCLVSCHSASCISIFKFSCHPTRPLCSIYISIFFYFRILSSIDVFLITNMICTVQVSFWNVVSEQILANGFPGTSLCAREAIENAKMSMLQGMTTRRRRTEIRRKTITG